MLDRFKVPAADQVHVPEADLRQTVAAIFEKMNLTPEDAAIGAEVLLTTDLRAHGIPLHKEVIQWFGQISGELGLQPLQTLDT